MPSLVGFGNQIRSGGWVLSPPYPSASTKASQPGKTSELPIWMSSDFSDQSSPVFSVLGPQVAMALFSRHQPSENSWQASKAGPDSLLPSAPLPALPPEARNTLERQWGWGQGPQALSWSPNVWIWQECYSVSGASGRKLGGGITPNCGVGRGPASQHSRLASCPPVLGSSCRS